ncbi:glycoside hydrolase family 3 C-terminal domain-containing protein, partial [Mycena haematopus]
NTIVVLHVVGPVLMESWIEHPNVTAVLHAGLPGQESGNALVDMLFSDGAQATNPSGRLPYTIARAREDYPAHVLCSSTMQTPQMTYEEGLHIDYRWFGLKGITPRFEFGFGLSYTTFTYTTARASAFVTLSTRAASEPPSGSSLTKNMGEPAVLNEEIISVSFRVENAGTVARHEVPQFYLGFPIACDEPPKVLRGFSRLMLERGESKSATISLRRKDVSIWDVVSQQWMIATGTFTVMVGSSSRTIHWRERSSYSAALAQWWAALKSM